ELNKREKQHNIIVVGDMNIDIQQKMKLKTLTNRCEEYEFKMAQNGFEHKIMTTTREEKLRNKTTKSCIDHILIKSKRLNSIGIVNKTKIADHYITALMVWTK